MARVFNGERTFLDPVLRPVERLIYAVSGVDPRQEQHWTTYTAAMLLFNLAGFVLLYALQRLQHVLPLNPQGFDPPSPDSAFNTAVSFTSNTNWQSYSGESTMSYLSQMAGLTVQNFVSAAMGIVLAIALIRGFARHSAQTLGNFWVDLVRTTLWVLLPLSLIFALVLVWQGVPQNLQAYVDATTVEGGSQTIAQGPVASQEAIKMLGTNGGGFFNANSAHPYENPTPLSNFLEMLAIFVIGAALTYTFGHMVGDTRQGWAIFGAMMVGVLHGRGRGLLGRVGRQPGLRPPGDRHSRHRHAGRRQHGGQRGPLWHRQLGAVGDGDDRCVKWLGQLHARLLHAARRPGAAVQHHARRGHRRRRGLRPVRHAVVRHRGGVYRRADGRAGRRNIWARRSRPKK